jgi:hypothetical protein
VPDVIITKAKAVVVADKMAFWVVVIIVKFKYLEVQNVQNMVMQ